MDSKLYRRISPLQNGNENGIRQLVLFAKTSSQGYYLGGVLFPAFRTGCISKCVLTAEVTLSGPLVLGAVCLHLPWYLQMPGKTGKLFSVSGLQGKLGLTISAMLIATSLLESWNSASLLGLRDEKGRGKSVCACVNTGTAATQTYGHTCAHELCAHRGQVCCDYTQLGCPTINHVDYLGQAANTFHEIALCCSTEPMG